MQKPILAITIRSFTLDETVRSRLESHFTIGYINTTGRRLTETELLDAVMNADVVIAGTEKLSQTVIESSQKLKVISRVGVGLDSVDLDAASRRGVQVLTTAASTIQPVAEQTLALIFCLAKRIVEYNESVRKDEHEIKQASLIDGKTVGIIGIGRIGSRVGELLLCLGCPVIFFDPFVPVHPNPAFVKAESLEQLLSKADIITLHVPAQKDDAPLLNREAFNQCRKGVIIVNTARGSLVDEQALFEALRSGCVACAGLDVTAQEPYRGPLLSLPQVIITPHVASNTQESRSAMEHEAVENCIRTITKGKI